MKLKRKTDWKDIFQWFVGVGAALAAARAAFADALEDGAMNEIHFAQPEFLWALAALPFLAALIFYAEKMRRTALDRLIAARLQPRLAGNVSIARRRAGFALLVAGVALARGARASAVGILMGAEAAERTRCDHRDGHLELDARDGPPAEPAHAGEARRGGSAEPDRGRPRGAARVCGIVVFAGAAHVGFQRGARVAAGD